MAQYIADRFRKNWLRFGTNVNHFSAMCVWDGKLILGMGEEGDYPNLVFADWSVVTEKSQKSGDDYTDASLVFQWRTKSLDFGLPDAQKQVRCIDIIYQDHYDWDGETISILYRVDRMGVFTSIGTISLGEASAPYQTMHVNIPFDNLSSVGKFFEFQFVGTKHMRINKMIIYYDILSKKY